MKKLALCLALAVTFMSSCSTLRTATSRTVDVTTSISSTTKADLAVADKKIEYTYNPTRKERKNMTQHRLVEKSIALALKSNGNADVMVAVQHEIEKRGLIRKKIRSITVTGYPATYKNFKSVKE